MARSPAPVPVRVPVRVPPLEPRDEVVDATLASADADGAIPSPPDPLVALLQTLEGGRFGSEALTAHVSFAGALLLATEERLVFSRKGAGAGELVWHLPLDLIGAAEQSLTNPSVVLLTLNGREEDRAGKRGTQRTIECMTAAVVPLVLSTVRMALEQRQGIKEAEAEAEA